MNKDFTVFLTNDDSIHAKGFKAAIEVARHFGHVIAVAPATPQSGMSQAITIAEPLYFKKIEETPDVEIYSLSGTPVDCAKFAFDYFLKGRKIDLAISGINHGSNAAVNVLYSGTMGAAMECAFYNVPSIGLSSTDLSHDADFSAAVHYGIEIIEKVLNASPQLPLCLNINVPALSIDEIKGVKVCRQATGFWKEEFVPRVNPYGQEYFWQTGTFHNHEIDNPETDDWALRNGYISVVPIQVDMTDYSKKDFLHDLF